MLTNQVASYSIFTIQLLVVCLTLVRWPTMKNLTAKRKRLTAKRITSRWGKKKKTRGKKKNLTAKRKRLKAKRNPHGKKKKTHGKISSIPRGHFNSYFFCCEVVVILSAVRLFFLRWGFSFCREVNSFAVTVVGHHTFEILFPKILDFSTSGYSSARTSTNFAHLTSFQAIEFMDWPVPKTLDISVCQTSENKAFCNCCSSVVRDEEREHDLISSPVSTFSPRSA